jgi:hypothetical protein
VCKTLTPDTVDGLSVRSARLTLLCAGPSPTIGQSPVPVTADPAAAVLTVRAVATKPSIATARTVTAVCRRNVRAHMSNAPLHTVTEPPRTADVSPNSTYVSKMFRFDLDVHRVYECCSASGTPMAAMLAPTAVQAVVAVHDTPLRRPGWGEVGWIDQLVPFQCSASVL